MVKNVYFHGYKYQTLTMYRIKIYKVISERGTREIYCTTFKP